VLTDQYELDSQLAFYMRDIQVNQVNESIRYVSMLPPDQGLLAGTTGLYVASDPAQLARVQQCFDRIEKVVPISRRRRSGEPIMAYHLYVYGYRGGLPLD
jgi:hypothetical protein